MAVAVAVPDDALFVIFPWHVCACRCARARLGALATEIPVIHRCKRQTARSPAICNRLRTELKGAFNGNKLFRRAGEILSTLWRTFASFVLRRNIVSHTI